MYKENLTKQLELIDDHYELIRQSAINHIKRIAQLYDEITLKEPFITTVPNGGTQPFKIIHKIIKNGGKDNTRFITRDSKAVYFDQLTTKELVQIADSLTQLDSKEN